MWVDWVVFGCVVGGLVVVLGIVLEVVELLVGYVVEGV